MNLLSLSLAMWCSLLLSYMFIVSPVHGWEELTNKLKESKDETKLNKAEIQSLKQLLALVESARDDLLIADVMGKRSRSPMRAPPGDPSEPPKKNQRTKRVFDPASLISCRERNPLSHYTEGVPPALERNVRDFLHGGARNVDCGGGISLDQLKQIANSMLPRGVHVFNVLGGKSYAYLPQQNRCPGRFYESGTEYGDPNYTYDLNKRDSEMVLIRDCPNVQEYWSAWTPCYHCEQSLMDWKEKTNHEGTVTIHIGKIYNWGTKPTTPECLALMIRQGFDLVPWDWSMFQRKMGFSDRNVCQHLLDMIRRCEEFDTAYKAIKREIDIAEGLANRYRTRDLDDMCQRSLH